MRPKLLPSEFNIFHIDILFPQHEADLVIGFDDTTVAGSETSRPAKAPGKLLAIAITQLTLSPDFLGGNAILAQ
jgi:hypothetical protein